MSQQDLFSTSIPSVSELTDEIKQLIETNFRQVMVQGEVSNAKTSVSGHTYFTLKDEGAQLSCVIWRGIARSRNISVEDGQELVLGGDIDVYPPHGKYQLIVQFAEQKGLGALQMAFEQLKKKLKEEGLFEEAHKKPLPKFPKRIGVITSSTGAAFHDIHTTLAKRWPLADVLLYHASVQGDYAAPEIVEGIEYFGREKNVDVLIVGRGGGSLEDLWPFNEESVARAIYNCPVPVISAVGHEVDFSISDFVADARAATPTQAAVVATPDINEYRFKIDDLHSRILNFQKERLRRYSDRVQSLLKTHALAAVQEKVSRTHDRIRHLTERMQHRLALLKMQRHEKLNDLHYRLKSRNPNEPLERGFVRVKQDKKWKKRADEFNKEQAFTLQWEDGDVDFTP